jgi:hypothetical protein
MADVRGYHSELTQDQTPHEILKKTYDTLSNYTHWCQGADALNKYCQIVRINSPEAVAWSISGAVGKASNDLGIIPLLLLKYLNNLVVEMFSCDGGVTWYNDNHTHEQVLAFVQEALSRCS